MKIAVCDDDILELEKIKNAVEKFIISEKDSCEITLCTFTSGDALLTSINKHGCFDLLILDIIMPGMNGMEIASELRTNTTNNTNSIDNPNNFSNSSSNNYNNCSRNNRSRNNNCKIIFLTSSPEFAVKSYSVNAFYYLLKPFHDLELMSILKKALEEIGEENSESVIIKENSKLTRIQIHTIQYIECVKHKLFFHLRNGEIITCYGTMNEFTDILLLDKRFVKCHKSFLVNMHFVTNISNRDFVIAGKILVPISRQVYQQVKDTYIDYFFKKGV